MIKFTGRFKRVSALMISLLMLLGQLAMPVAALAGEVDMLPGVTLYYQANGQMQHVKVEAGLYGEDPVYWATVPEEAFSSPIGLVIDELSDGRFTCVSSSGEGLSPSDAKSPEEKPATQIEIYMDGQLLASYPLFVSTISMPSSEDNGAEQPGWPNWGDGGNQWPDWGNNGGQWPGWGGNEDTEEPEQSEPEQPQWPDWGSNGSQWPGWGGNEDTEEPEQSEPEQPQWPDWGSNGSQWPGWGGSEDTEKPEQSEPEQPAAQPVQIVINYADANGTVLFQESQTLEAGEHRIRANADAVRNYGYELDGGNDVSVKIEVYRDGTASRNPVTFTIHQVQQEPEETEGTLVETYECEGRTTKGNLRFRSSMSTASDRNIVFKGIQNGTIVWVHSQMLNKDGEAWYSIRYNDVDCFARADCLEIVDSSEPLSAEVKVYFTDEAGNEVYPTVTETFDEGTHDVRYLRKDAPEGYEYSYATAESVTVDANGANPEYVAFVYREVKPVNSEVKVYFTDEAGNEVYPTVTETFDEGTHDVRYLRKDAPEGYEYSYATAESVTVDANGVNPEYVAFVYKAVKPVSAEVKVYFTDEAGNEVYPTITETFDEGTHDVRYLRKDAPEGYEYSYATAESVTVDANGVNPEYVAFVYKAVKPVSAEVKVYFTDEAGNEVYPTITETFDEGTHDVRYLRKDAPEGYEYSYATAESVTVDANGVNPEYVAFVYREVKPVSSEVKVYFTDEAGNEVYPTITETFGEGTHDVRYLRKDAPEGYEYSYATAESVTVDANGANPEYVAFVYREVKPVSADVTFTYVDEKGREVYPANVQSFPEGTHDVTEYRYDAPDGYSFSYATAESVTVDANGASPSQISFIYTSVPNEAVLTVRHLDAERNPIAQDTTVSFKRNQFGKVYASADYKQEPKGYRYAGANEDEIVVDTNGSITPQVLELIYVEKPKAEASVTFEYICNRRAIADPLTVKLPEGTHDVGEYAANPEGYILKEVSSQTVTVDENGKANPGRVTFTYEEVSHTAILKVYYRNAIGMELPNSPEIRELEPGTHIIRPNSAYVPNGYVVSGSTQSYQVTVGSDLTAFPESITFTCYDANTTGSVTVNYYNSANNALITSEVRKLAPGVHDIAPDKSLVDAKGNYVLSDVITNTRVAVDERGTAYPAVVSFYYKPADIDVYQGYLLVTRQTALRKQPGENAQSVMTLPKDTVLWTAGQYQSGAILWNSSQVASNSNLSGWVNDADVRRISADEANARLEENNQQKEPDQDPGYYITIMDNVPLRRYMDTAAQAKYLRLSTVVYVSEQSYDEYGYLWHKTTYDGVTGFVRDGQLRKLSRDEVNEYLSSGNPIDPGEPDGGDQYDPNGASSYGYVTKDSVNFRAEPNGTRLKMLNEYAMALILDTKTVNGVKWYNINYSGQTGWIHGDYFHQMSLNEFNAFVGSDEYYEGITNNTAVPTAKPSTGTTGGSTGSATQGNVSSVEDWNVGMWQNPGAAPQASYEPFNPYATPVATMSPVGSYATTTAGVKLYDSASAQSASTTLPQGAQVEITGTTVMNGTTWYTVLYNGQKKYMEAGVSLKEAAATSTPAPTSTFVIGTMIPITYDDESKETQTGTVPWGLIGGAIALVGGAGGVYAYALNQNKRRKAAAARAAAARRKAAAAAGTSAAAGSASPYARRAVAAPPVAGTQQQRPNAPQQPYGGMNNPYSTGSITGTGAQPQQNPYSRPATGYQQPQAPAGYDSYAAPKPQANPYAAPVNDDQQQSRPTTAANPYARPISAPTAPADPAAPRRRSTRMQRYHESGSGEDSE